MKIRAVLFDLDGTLLPMDQDVFIKAYLGGLVKILSPLGYDPRAVADALWTSTDAMIRNTGERTNEQVFWDSFSQILGDGVRAEEARLDEFYRTDFQSISELCGFAPAAAEIVGRLRSLGIRVILATNPLFPAVATESRVRWAGLDPADFELITTYDNSLHCKPNLDYYSDILRYAGLAPEECLMVGNDVGDDMVAEQLGMKVFLLTDNLINKSGADISVYPNGSFERLYDYLDEVMQ